MPTPKESLQRLVEGNKRYVHERLLNPNRSAERREELKSDQNPFAIVVGCSDSRVTPEILFDQGLGDIFVVRVAGNVMGPLGVASVEYAVEVLGAPLIFVLGHENCGAVQAALSRKPDDIAPISNKIEKAVKEHSLPNETGLEGAIKANVRAVVEQLQQEKPLADLIAKGKLGVVGGYYNLESGKIELCCEVSFK